MTRPSEEAIVLARERLAPYLAGYPAPMIDSRRLRIASGKATVKDREEVTAEDWVLREERGWDNPTRDAARSATARKVAGDAVLRSVAEGLKSGPGDASTRTAWVLVNTSGFNDFPPAVKAWDASVGPHVFYPAPVLAAFALGLSVPEKAS